MAGELLILCEELSGCLGNEALGSKAWICVDLLLAFGCDLTELNFVGCNLDTLVRGKRLQMRIFCLLFDGSY